MHIRKTKIKIKCPTIIFLMVLYITACRLNKITIIVTETSLFVPVIKIILLSSIFFHRSD